MGNLLIRQSNATTENSSKSSGKLRRKFLQKKSRPSKMIKTDELSKEEQAKSVVPAGFPPANSNYFNSSKWCKQEEDEDFLCIIDWIPMEVLSHCFSFLSVKDVYSASLVCKTFYKAATDILLWKTLCYRDLRITQKWICKSWIEYYKMVRYITWDQENCCPNEFKFSDNHKTISKLTSYGVATARSKYLFVPSGLKYVFEVKVNFRRPNFFYGIGFIDKDIGFNFTKACYPKVESTNAEVQEKKYDLQWFYWSDGNCWDILGSHPVSTKTRTFVSKKGIERQQGSESNAQQQPSLAFYSNDIIGIVLDYSAAPRPLLTFFLNNQKAHQFALPKPMELYLAVYFYNASDSVSIMHCDSDKYDALMNEA